SLIHLSLVSAETRPYSNTFSDSFEDETEEQRREDALQPLPCETGYFECSDSLYCVKQKYNCDKIEDCEDGSDEHNCTDNSKSNFFDKMFAKRPDEDRETRKANCSWNSIPEKCTCSKKSIFCVNQTFSYMPNNMPKEVKELILTKAHVFVIGSGAFNNLKELTYLNLIGNRITRLPKHIFRNNTNLRILYLSHNPLKHIDEHTFSGLSYLKELDLRYCQLTALEHLTFEPLKNLELLWLQRNNIKVIAKDAFVGLSKLDTLSLSFNNLFKIHHLNFFDLTSLKSLSLSYNELEILEKRPFETLRLLEKLDLSHNKITFIDKKVFLNVTNLVSLDLRGNNFRKIDRTILSHAKELMYIYFDEFKQCSTVPHVRVCYPRTDGISSVNHLLDNVILRVSVWIVAFIACIGNVSVLVGRMIVVELNENLALADFLMGLYLFIIAYHDVEFRNEYINHESSWRSSWQCQFSGVLSTISSESSVFILVFITADRYVSVMYPFSMKRRRISNAVLGMFVVWSLSIAIAIIPLVFSNWFPNEFYGNNGVCLALQIHDTFAAGWQYSFLVFVVLNSIAFGFIAFAYIKMATTIIHSSLSIRSTQMTQDKAIAKRCSFIVATDGVCWLPIVMIKVAAIGGIPINQDLYAWVAVFLLPVNSALNPVLYTLTTKMFKQQMNRMFAHRFSSRYRGHQPSTAAGENSNSSFCSISQRDVSNANNHTVTTAGGNGVYSSKFSSQNSLYLFNRRFPTFPFFTRKRSTKSNKSSMKPINEPVEETTDNRPMISMSNFSVAKNNEPAENLTSPVTLQVKRKQ
ncbi:hypothetical protein TYRP_015788, partial [Tyrophagus putrescentiae]